MVKLIIGIAIIAIIAVVLVTGIQKVDSGDIGVLRTGGEVDQIPRSEGYHLVIPVIQEITPMSIQIQKYESSAASASKDLQTVETEVTVNYHLLGDKVPWIFQNLGMSFEDRIIKPAILETVKQVTANYNAEELITKRPEVKAAIEESIQSRLAQNEIIVDSISITEFDFSISFNAAIEAKVESLQKALKAENDIAIREAEARQRITVSEGIAAATIAEAEGNAAAVRLAGDAEAYAIDVKAAALKANPDLLAYQNIQQWNGELPYFYSGSDGDSPQMLLSIGSETKSP